MLTGGLTLCIDTTNPKKEIFSSYFPRGKTNGTGIFKQRGSDGKTTRNGSFDLKEKLTDSEMEMELRTYGDTRPTY